MVRFALLLLWVAVAAPASIEPGRDQKSAMATPCDPISPPMSGSYSCSIDHLGRMSCTPSCMDGFEFETPPAAEYVCEEGTWSPPGPYPNCVFAGQKCEKIPPPFWGSYRCQTDHTGTERCYPSCMEGYEFESPPAAEYVCVNGQFSPPGPYPNCRKSEDTSTTTTVKPASTAAPPAVNSGLTNIGNECLGDTLCGDRVTCSAWGDPHYTTFDGKRFNFQGNCKYVLSRGMDFQVSARNVHRRGNTRVSFVDAVEFELYGNMITITQGKEVYVNGVKWSLPICLNSLASITQQGNNIVIDTALCVTVTYDGNHRVTVELPPELAWTVGGLCGNANGNQGDDLIKPDMTPVTDPVEFGNSWTALDDVSCPALQADQQFDITQADQAFVQELESQQFCGHLQDTNSPFSACFAAVEPTEYVETCVYDMAASGSTSDHSLMCENFEEYVRVCAAAGVHIDGWREQTGCALQCPPNSHYSYSTSACQDSCRTPTASSTCGLPNVEGCECDPGYIWSGMTCVEPKDCGCLHEGNYHTLGEVWGTEDGQQCECLPNWQVSCAPMSCLPGAEWGLQDGVYGCHQIATTTIKPTTTTTQTPKPTTTTTQTPKPTTTPTPTTTPAAAPSAACEMQADIVFVVDGSASIPAYEFEKVKTFLNNVVGHFDISPTATQVGVVQYSTSPQQEFALNAHSSLVGLQQAISNIAVISRGTSTGSALTFARDQALTAANGARPGVPKIVVVVTDGRSGDDVILPSQNLHNDGVITFAIGVTESINYQELSAIAGRPDHISTVFDFDALEDIMEPLSSQLCEVETTTLKPTTTTTQTPKPTTTTTQTPKPTTTPTPPTLPTPAQQTTTMKAVTPQEDAPMSDDVVNIGNECLGDVFCGDRVTCSARGDPHYNTFDGKRFNFQGNCKYVLSRGKDFTIAARNYNRRNNMRVSFVDEVEFTLYGSTITITRDKEVFVNGVKWALPCCIGGFASITQQGNYIVIDTILCITVKFGANHHVIVELPAHLAGLVHGMCGNANGIQGDDLVKPDTTPATDAVEFGNSWVAPDDMMSCPTVLADQQFDITQADQAFVQELESQQFCGHLQDTNSLFSACFAAVEPTDFIEDCVYDMAASGNTRDTTLMCDDFEGYVQECAAAGIYLEGWREQTGCALQCPPNAHYSYSTSACQDSCRTPTASSTCGLPNVEGCECDPGYIWSGMTCVEPKDCGCLHEGNYHALGEQWGTEDGQFCECQPNFQANCALMSCLPGAEWSLQDGVYGCHQVPTLQPIATTTQTPKPTTTTTQTPKPTTTPTPPSLPTPAQQTTTLKPVTPQEDAPMSNDVVNIGNECLGDVFCGDRVTCSARGDPHYNTFDGKRFNFQGNCKYVLSRGKDFTIAARNYNRRNNMRVSFVDEVEFTLYGSTITITRDKEVFVNGVKWALPCCIGGFASITQQGNYIVIDTILCITVKFGANHHVIVELPAHLAGLVHGMCGNANGIQGDDLVKPDTTPATDAVEFGNSWVAPDDMMSCPTVLADQQFDIAQADQAFVQELESQQFCGHLQDTNSPFSPCFAAVEPVAFIEDCVYDMAASGNNRDTTLMCDDFEGYVQECAAAGIHLEGWREQTGCALQCPPNAHYSYSTSACQDSCRTPTASSTCGLPNVEGCECDPGYIWSGMTCVEPKDCGCLHEGNYHALGEQWGTEDGQHCECQPNFQAICAPMSCLPGSEWSLQDGVYGCHQVPTLKPTTTTTPPPSTAACEMQADIVFVVDGSASIPAYEFEKVKTFLNNVVGHFDISPTATQVGVVQYSSSPQQEFALNAHSSLVSLQQAISNIAVISRGTSTGSALTFARDQALTAANGARPGVPKIVVVVTDGRSGDDVILPSQNLHNDGVITFAIGVTESINYQELSAIAGRPDHISTVFDFDALEDIMEPLSSQLCEVETTTLKPTTTTTQTPKPTTTTTQTPKPTTTPTPTTTTQTPKPTTTPTPSSQAPTLPTLKPTTTTMKPASEAPVAPVSNDVVNIGNECLGDVLCGDRVTCSARGDPHYRTFDGKRFNFQGNCKYVLSRGQDFIISARNANRRGNMRVSFVDAVEFSLHGHIITITQGKEVFVNGVKWTLPICLGFASITQQGNNIVIDTTLCITVTFDGNHHVTVQLPAHLAGLVGGLCGNANGIQGDDLIKPDMTPATDAVEFGNSWVAPDDMSCPAVLADQQFDITQADQAFVQELESQQFCGHLQDTNSPFSACFAAVEPSDYIDDCVYDMAASGSTADHTFMCENFEGYVQACAAAGIHLDGWREQAGCTLQCPPHAHYSYSTSACQDSCRTPTASSTCGLPNVEGCECDPGYIWSGMTCVEPKDCGCLHEGNYHALGEQWGTWDGQHCECQPNFQVICAPMSCQPGAEWGLQDGVWGCHQIPTLKPTTTTTQTPKPTTTPTPTTTTKPTTTLRPDDMPQTFDIEDSCIGPHTCPANVAMCTAFGDPHYQTFDGKGYFFQGACKYTLVRHQNFNVAAKNGHRMGDTRVSFVDAVELTLYGHTIWLLKDREVMIDGVRRTLPVCLNNQATIRLSGDMVVVETDMCVTVKYDGDHRVEVEVPPEYASLVDGLCGNFNGNPDDELLRPDQTPALNEVDMGNSWLAPDDAACLPLQEQFDISTIDQALLTEIESVQNCGQITDISGAFQPCINVVNSLNYFDACVYDMAAENGDHEMLCNAMEAYVDACANAGVTIVGWRDDAQCFQQCPPNSHYSYSTSACQDSCRTPTASSTCGLPNVEGCECDPGYIWSGMTCVEPKDCGCLHEMDYHTLGEQWGTEDGQHCACQPNFQVTCVPMACLPGAEWSLQDGVFGCHQVPTLKPTTTTTQTPKPTTTTTPTPKPTTTPTPRPTTTTTQSPKPTTTPPPDDMPQTFDIEDNCIGHVTCPATVAMCTAFGDPHYQTFDGKGYFFQGACKYILVRHGNFNVVAKNGHRLGDTRVSFVDAVELTLYGHTIWLLKNREVMIDGVRRTLPVCLNSQATIRLSGDMVMVETDMCVTVKYDGDHRVEVEVPPDYAGQVDGLCGNFNGNPDDELLRPDQTLALNEVDMGNSWLAPDDLACLPNQEQFDISTVDQAFMGELESTTNCGQITDVNGAFQPCIDYVNPANYFDACVYDMAAENGDHEMMCNAMEAYADACAAAGVVIVGWRDESLCGVDCPPNSHYSLVTACPATCANPLAPMRCSRTTLPGCACDEGYVLSGDRCVRAEECGCLQGNQYYALGEEWGVESTGQLCVCMSGGTIQCLAGIPSCDIEEQWSLQDGVLGCHPVNTPCDMKADVVFVVESSYSVPPTEFDKVRSFLKHVVEKVTIGADATQIAVVSYSSFPSLEFALHEHDNVFELKAGINNIRHIGLGTATGAALGFAGDVVLSGAHGARPGVPKIVVLITASPSEDDMALAAQTLHSRGVTVHAIGVGSGLSPAQLQQVASSPVYASTVIDFSGLGSLKEVLPETLCQNAADVINSWLTSTTSKPTTKPTTTSRPDDPPVADAGLDQTVQSTQTVVMLDGTGSHDDHGIISFFWQYPDQHLPVTLGDTSSPTLAVANLVPGEYTFTLTVTDASGQQDTDDVTVVVNKPTTPAPTTTKGTTTPTAALDHPPVAFAGADEVVHLPQNTLTLDGSLSTDDHGIVSYQWEYVDHKLPVDMVGTLSPQLQLSNLHPGEYTFVLTVTDTAGQQGSDDVLVIVQPEIMTVVNPLHPDQPLHDETFQAHAPGTCSAVGDPHYHTFDGKLFSFSGDCWYVLAKNRNPLEEQFAVLADNARCEIEGWEHEACTRAVKVQYRGSELLLTRDSISLNGQTVQGPISHNGNTVEKIENSYFHKVTLDNGLEILWDSHTRVYVKSPGTLQAKTAGLCGDFNGNPEDDFTTPSGSKVLLADTFAQSWKYGDCTP